MSSDEGLDAYGAATWGQFFIYQGFNPHIGWMHTSSGVDNVDEFAEKVERRGEVYLLLVRQRPAGRSSARPITIRYRTADGAPRLAQLHRVDDSPRPDRSRRRQSLDRVRDDGPAGRGAAAELPAHQGDRPRQSFMRISDLKANSSNNTVFADDKGEIAVLSPQFMPRRDNRFDYTKPVDGSDPATDWRGLHAVVGAAQHDQPADRLGVQQQRLALFRRRALIRPSRRVPALPRHGRRELSHDPRDAPADAARSLDASIGCRRPPTTAPSRRSKCWCRCWSPRGRRCPPATRAARAWPRRSRRWRAGTSAGAIASVPNTLAQFWGDELAKAATSREWDDHRQHVPAHGALTPAEKLDTFARGLDRLERDFGGWRVPWGEVNRFQRIDPAIDPRFDDTGAEHPGRLHLEQMGLARLVRRVAEAGHEALVRDQRQQLRRGRRVRPARPRPGGDRRAAKAATRARRTSTTRRSAMRRAICATVYFYPDQLKGHTERVYRPGE